MIHQRIIEMDEIEIRGENATLGILKSLPFIVEFITPFDYKLSKVVKISTVCTVNKLEIAISSLLTWHLRARETGMR